ncbi:DUF1822 family protein [Cyanobacteria bacterium FACHB-472]|nr:DUF1822 family protein [Cyanobacteria bacterium FACHB-472]
MINPDINTTDIVLDFEVTTGQIIPLQAEHYTQAIEISDQVPTKARQWQTYLNVLGLSAFEEWLKERSFDIIVDKTQCSVLQPQYANVFEAVCNLKVGKFKLCLIITESLIDRVVTVPRVAIELPEFAAHLYVVIEVLEEEEQVSIQGFLSYAQLQKAQKSGNLTLEREEWIYELPLDWFDLNANNLLFCLRLVNPAVFGLPVPPVNRATILSQMRESLEKLLPQMATLDAELCKVLNWEQAVALYTAPELLENLYKLQTQPLIEDRVAITNSSEEPSQPLVQRAVNVAFWLQDQIDEFAKSLSWGLPSPLTPVAATGWRSTELFDPAIAELWNRGINIPHAARGSCKKLDGTPLELFAAIWLLPQESAEPMAATEPEELSETTHEWWLLLILGMQSGGFLPRGTKLQVRDLTNVLSDQVLEIDDYYLGTQVVGNPDDQFFVIITLDGVERKLAPFVFAPAKPSV